MPFYYRIKRLREKKEKQRIADQVVLSLEGDHER